MIASQRGHLEVVKALLDGSASWYFSNGNGDRALDLAIEHKHPEIIALLKQHIAISERKREKERKMEEKKRKEAAGAASSSK